MKFFIDCTEHGCAERSVNEYKKNLLFLERFFFQAVKN